VGIKDFKWILPSIMVASTAIMLTISRYEKRSLIFLGKSKKYEKELSKKVGVNLSDFYRLQTDLVWSLFIPKICTYDPKPIMEEMLSKYGNAWFTHLCVAFAEKCLGNLPDADKELQVAKKMYDPSHPFAFIMPSDSEWNCQKPTTQKLEEVEPNMVWNVWCYYNHPKGENKIIFTWSTVATILRMKDGSLIIINPIEMSQDIVKQINHLGNVTHVICATSSHSLFVKNMKQQFPQAKQIGVPGHKKKHLDFEFDGMMDDDNKPLFPGEIDQILQEGAEDIQDVYLYHRRTKTLFIHDSIWYRWQNPEEPGAFWASFDFWSYGVLDSFGVGYYVPITWSSFHKVQKSWKKLLELDFERVAGTHLPWNAVSAIGTRFKFAKGIQWAMEISTMEAAYMSFKFVVGHPKVMWGVIKNSKK